MALKLLNRSSKPKHLGLKELSPPKHSILQKVIFLDGQELRSGTVIGWQLWNHQTQTLSGVKISQEMGWSAPGWWVSILVDRTLDTELVPESEVH